MLIIPAIDLQNGQCVRLQQGQFDRVSTYAATPSALAERYANQGATRLHIVDLEGAKSGTMQQLALIKTMNVSNMTIQVGGGIRSIAAANACLTAGITTLVIGSMAISDPELTLQMIELVGAEHVILAFDVNMEEGIPKPAIHGWQTSTMSNLWQVVAFYHDAGVATILCTDIACDGMMNGPNFTLYEEAVSRFSSIHWQASGGIRHIDDIRALSAAGVHAVILGRMLYESDFNLSACIQEMALC